MLRQQYNTYEITNSCIIHILYTGCAKIEKIIPAPKGKNKFGNFLYGVSQEECARIREGVPYVKVYRYNPIHLCPKLNGYGFNGQRKVWSSCGSTHCTCQLTILSISVLGYGVIRRQFSLS